MLRGGCTQIVMSDCVGNADDDLAEILRVQDLLLRLQPSALCIMIQCFHVILSPSWYHALLVRASLWPSGQSTIAPLREGTHVVGLSDTHPLLPWPRFSLARRIPARETTRTHKGTDQGYGDPHLLWSAPLCLCACSLSHTHTDAIRAVVLTPLKMRMIDAAVPRPAWWFGFRWLSPLCVLRKSPRRKSGGFAT